MMHQLGTRLLAVVALQFLILFGVIGFKQYTVVTGETVLLKTEPIDPRSLFRGDYVSLRYTISRLDTGALAGDDFFGYRAAVYVELAREESGYWRAVAVYDDRRDVEDGHALIKGRLQDDARFGSSSDLSVDYGIEEVFVPEGSGRAIETSQAELAVEVRVDRFGNAVPRRIFIDGEPAKLERR